MRECWEHRHVRRRGISNTVFLTYNRYMWFFSRKQDEPVEIHRADDGPDSELSDIIDLRAMREKAEERKRQKHRPQIMHARLSSEKENTIKNLFSKKRGDPRIIHRPPRTFRIPQLPRISRPSKKLTIAGGVAVCIVLGALLFTTAFSSATIVIQPQKSEIPLSKQKVTVDPALALIDVGSRRIPGEEVKYIGNVSLTFSATGQKNVETRSRGAIIIKNAFSSSPQTLVAQTRFQDRETRKIFRIQRAVTVPGAKTIGGSLMPSTIEVAVVADGIGAEYNLQKGSFTIPGFQGSSKYDGFTAEAKSPFIGGFKGNSKVVTADDLKTALATFEKEARSAIDKKRAAELPERFIVIPEAEVFEIADRTAPRVGDPGEEFTITGQARLANIAFEPATLVQFFNMLLHGDAASNQTPLPKQSTLTYEAKVSKDGVLDITVSGKVALQAVVNKTLVVTAVSNRLMDDAKTRLRAIEGVGAFGIKLFPFWKKTLPRDMGKISIQIQDPS